MKKIRAWIIMGAACIAVILLMPEDYGAVMSYAGAGLMQFLWNLIPVFLCVGLMVVRVDMNMAICAVPAPFFSSSDTIGNTARTGTRAAVPAKAAVIIPRRPDSAPRICLMVSGFRRIRAVPVTSRIVRKYGITPSIIEIPFCIPLLVLSWS